MNKPRIVVLGAGFGGLELSTLLSETFDDRIDVTLIDKSDAFVFGFSKLDIMFGHTTLDAVRLSKAKEYDGFGICYIEFGGGRIGKVEVDFFSGPKPTGTCCVRRSHPEPPRPAARAEAFLVDAQCCGRLVIGPDGAQ
jgi:hypothetical protein